MSRKVFFTASTVLFASIVAGCLLLSLCFALYRLR